MPKTQKPTKAALARLARLPRRSDLVIEGGKRPLGIFIRENDQTVQPQLALWLDAQSGFIRGMAVINPLESTDGGIGEALAALVDAAMHPVVAPQAAPARDEGAKRPGRARLAPLQPPPPGLPARIVVDDAALAEAARAIFAPLDVPVEVSEHLPAFEEAFASVAPYLGARPDAEPPQPFAWEIDAALLPALYKAAASYARRSPWQYMPDHPPVAVRLGANGPEPGVDTLYASIMGGGGQVTGIAFYYTLDEYRSAARRGTEIADRDQDLDEAIALLRQAGAPVDQMEPAEVRELVGGFMEWTGRGPAAPPEVFDNALVFFLEEKDESDPTYLAWLAAHGLKYTRHHVPNFLRTAADSTPRQPDSREVRALTLAIEALAAFFKEYERVLQGPYLPVQGLSYQATVQNNAAKVSVDICFPPENYDWDADVVDAWEQDEDDDLNQDEQAQPGSLDGRTTVTVYRFQVRLAWKESVWRRIEVRGDQTLHDLHRAIQRAFDWDYDRLYAFFLSGKAWDSQSEYASPFGAGRSASQYRLQQLPLRPGQQFLYIFDFGDELRHLITLEAITPGAVQAGVQYPRITESHGEAAPQDGD